jgi:hypothetical protein
VGPQVANAPRVTASQSVEGPARSYAAGGVVADVDRPSSEAPSVDRSAAAAYRRAHGAVHGCSLACSVALDRRHEHLTDDKEQLR